MSISFVKILQEVATRQRYREEKEYNEFKL